jgi:hypothetical protein
VPGGPRGLQNRRRYAAGEVGSIPILSANLNQSLWPFRCAKRARRPQGDGYSSCNGKGGETHVA